MLVRANTPVLREAGGPGEKIKRYAQMLCARRKPRPTVVLPHGVTVMYGYAAQRHGAAGDVCRHGVA